MEDWQQAAAPSGAAEETTPSTGVVEVVVGGRVVQVPAPVTAGELINALPATPADTYYIVVSAEGRKLPADEELSPGDKVFLVPVRVDG